MTDKRYLGEILSSGSSRVRRKRIDEIKADILLIHLSSFIHPETIHQFEKNLSIFLLKIKNYSKFEKI